MDGFTWFLIIFGAICLGVAIFIEMDYRKDMKRWNKGKCVKCGADLEQVGYHNSDPKYKCPKCGHEVIIWWTRTI